MAKKTNSRRGKNSHKAIAVKSLDNVENSVSSMLSGIFDSAGQGTVNILSHPFQLGEASVYNPLSLNRILLTYAYSTFGIIQTFIDQPVEDAFRGGIDIETEELSEDELDQLQDVLIECGDYQEMKAAMRWAKLYGGAGLIINTDQDPKEELDIDAIDENSPLSFIAADRWELLLNYLYEEQIETPFNYYGESIHKTRVVKVNGKDAPAFLRSRLQGWGMSELERVIRDINSYTKNQDVIFELLDEAKIDVWHLQGLNTNMMSSGSQAKVSKRLQLATQMKSHQKALIMDKEDDYEQKQISFGGLAEMQHQNRLGIAAAVRIPMTKLFGQSSAGFNSGEDDIENYNSLVESEVRSKAREIVQTVVKLRCQQLFGFIPEHFEIKFKPLRILGAEQEETVKDAKFQRGSTLYSQGMLSPEEYMEYLKKEGVISMQTEVGDGKREPEPPTSPSMEIETPQKVVNLKNRRRKDGTTYQEKET